MTYERIFRIVILVALALILYKVNQINIHVSGEQCYEAN